MRWLVKLQKLIRIQETLFGLPLALTGALLPFANADFASQYSWKSEWIKWCWILLAFSAARTAGMAFNRIVDRNIDAANPRTKNRPLPAGEVTVSQVKWLAWSSLFLFIFCAWQLGPLTFLFSPLVAFLLIVYSYTKRFTALSHFVLGLIEFFAPFLGWTAVVGSLGLPPLCLGIAVMLWISGMDMIYAIQDLSFDRQYRLHSMPVQIGVQKTLLLAKFVHFLSFTALLIAGLLAQVHPIYFVGLLVIAGLFIYQHSLVKPHDLSQIQRAFFTCNSLIAVTQCTFTLGSILWI